MVEQGEALIFAKPPRLNLIGTHHRCPPFAHPRPLSADQARRARTTTSWRLRAAAIAELSWLSCHVLVASYEPPRRDSSDAGATNARASKGIASAPARTRRALGCSRQTRPLAHGLKRWLGARFSACGRGRTLQRSPPRSSPTFRVREREPPVASCYARQAIALFVAMVICNASR
jgi:hypothetical protein